MTNQRSLSERMRAIQRQHPATAETKLPERLLESVRQSLKAEGYDIPITRIREIAERFETEVATP